MRRALISVLTLAVGILAVSVFNRLNTAPLADPTFVAAPTVKTELIVAETTALETPFFESFGPEDYFSGWLIADDFKGMPEVWTILLDREDKGTNRWTATVLTSNADGSPNDKDVFESIELKADRDRLIFKTRKIRGVQYFFDGRFLRSGKDFVQDEKVIDGTMRKTVKGKEFARFTANLAYAEPHCFH